MYAKAYELLVRMANDCGPLDVDGADANIYRVYAVADKLYTEVLAGGQIQDTRRIDELAYDSGYKTAALVAHIKASIYKVMKESNELDDEQYNFLQQNLQQLVRPAKPAIDKVIKTTYELFRKLGLVAE